MRSGREICLKLTIKTLETNRKKDYHSKHMYVYSTPEKYSNNGILGKVLLRYH